MPPGPTIIYCYRSTEPRKKTRAARWLRAILGLAPPAAAVVLAGNLPRWAHLAGQAITWAAHARYGVHFMGGQT